MGFKIVGGLLLLLLSAVAVESLAQFSVGVQAPLALIGGLTLGPIGLEAGLPLRFDLGALGALLTLRWTFEPLMINEVALWPFVGAGAQLTFSSLDEVGWYGLLGFQMHASRQGLWVYVQLGLWPGFDRGLLESVSIGARLEL